MFRRQLQHDRQLVRDQLAADRTERVHEARRLAARQLGSALIAGAHEFESMDDQDIFSAVKVPGFEGEHGAPGAKKVYLAEQAARYELDLDDTILNLWRARLAWWRGVRAIHASGQLNRLSEKDRAHVLFALTDEFFSPNGAQLIDLGTALLRWDGVGEVPTLDRVEKHGSPAEIARALEVILARKLPHL